MPVTLGENTNQIFDLIDILNIIYNAKRNGNSVISHPFNSSERFDISDPKDFIEKHVKPIEKPTLQKLLEEKKGAETEPDTQRSSSPPL